MSKRLQVLLEEREFRDLRRRAKGMQVTVAEYVRQALRQAARQQPSRSPAQKLAAIREAAKHSFPTGDIETMLEEIERGYLND